MLECADTPELTFREQKHFFNRALPFLPHWHASKCWSVRTLRNWLLGCRSISLTEPFPSFLIDMLTRCRHGHAWFPNSLFISVGSTSPFLWTSFFKVIRIFANALTTSIKLQGWLKGKVTFRSLVCRYAAKIIPRFRPFFLIKWTASWKIADLPKTNIDEYACFKACHVSHFEKLTKNQNNSGSITPFSFSSVPPKTCLSNTFYFIHEYAFF